MEDLPVFADVTFGEFEFVDVRGIISLEERGAAQLFVSERQNASLRALNLYPRTLFCACPEVEEADARILAATPVEDRGAVRVKIEEQAQFRISKDDVRGARTPLALLVRRNGVPWGAWIWYSIQILVDAPPRLGLRAGYWPAFPTGTSKRDLVKHAADFNLAFLNTTLRLVDGRVLDFVEITAPTIEGMGKELEIIRFHYEYLATLGIDVERQPDRRQPGREDMVLRKRSGDPRAPARA